MPVGVIVRDPVHATLRVEFRAEAGREKPVAKQATRGVEDEHLKQGLKNGEPMRPGKFCEPAHNRVHILDVVKHRFVLAIKAIIDGHPVLPR